MATQNEIALAMIQQLRMLDPSVSASVGTPERKIIDTVAQVIAERSIDLNQLEGAFDIDSKFGEDLDSFLAIFGYGRQTGSQAIGYCTFSRVTPSVYAIPIPSGTPVQASLDSESAGVNFVTAGYGEIPAGGTEVTVPIRATVVGTIGNVATGSINSFGRTPITGVTTVTNEIPTRGGSNPETDAEFKVRFKNTVFRNLAGTYDQYLALAVATQFTTKANVVGPISRYQEYIQVPDVDDASPDPDSGDTGNGSTNDFTSALSTIPYSKHTYDSIPYYLTNGEAGANAVFYKRDLDFVMNSPPIFKGDTFRQLDPALPNEAALQGLYPHHPNVTFRNVFTLDDTTVQALRPGDIVLFEHSYMSDCSRNDWDRQILNAVDVFVNGSNPTLADTTAAKPNGSDNMFTSDSSSFLYSENYRRAGEAARRPVQGNIFTGLFHAPVTDLPSTISTSDATYHKGVHYFVIQESDELGGTVRARTGIEWNPTVKGQAASDPASGPYTGPTIAGSVDKALNVIGYSYDRNIVDLQLSLESNKQITTDVLAHASRTRYFKLDITVMYSSGSSSADVNTRIRSAVQTYFDGQYYGSVIQMSDLLQTIHNVAGVDNVRWSRDLTGTRHNLTECDNNGESLANALIDRRTYGHASATEVQQLYLTGTPVSGTFKLQYQNGTPTASIAYNASGATILAALQAQSVPVVSVTGAGTATAPYVITFSANGLRDLIKVSTNALVGAATTFDYDFFLKDDELPSLPGTALSTDTVAGLIIRPRAQNTWNQL